MANLTQTAANVGLTDSTDTPLSIRYVEAGEAITQGMPVYQDAATNEYFQSDANASATAAAATAIALTAGADGEKIVIAEQGDIDIGATLTVGETYVVSATKGAIAPIADLTTGDYPTILGVASAADTLKFKPYSGGVAKP